MKKTTHTTISEPTIADLMQIMLSMQQELSDFKVSVENRFNSIDSQFKAIDNQFSSVENRFRAIDATFISIETRFNLIDRQFSNLRTGMDNRFDEVNLKLDQASEELGETIAFITQKAVDQTEFQAFKKSVHRHERAITQLQRHTAAAS